MRTLGRTLLAGALALLPLVLTLLVMGWAAEQVYGWLGPHSRFGRALIALGLTLATREAAAYVIGIALLLSVTWLAGIFVRSRFAPWATGAVQRAVSSVPLVGSIYDLSRRFVGILDRQPDADLRKMSPVWCFFGGPGGAAVLALLSTPEAVELAGRRYHVILVPSAPVPIGGGLLYVPADWIQPAGFGVDVLTSIYVSMGVTLPKLARQESGQAPLRTRV